MGKTSDKVAFWIISQPISMNLFQHCFPFSIVSLSNHDDDPEDDAKFAIVMVIVRVMAMVMVMVKVMVIQ